MANIRNGKLLNSKELLIERVERVGVENALLEHYKDNPNTAISRLSFSFLKKHFNDLQQIKVKVSLDQNKKEKISLSVTP